MMDLSDGLLKDGQRMAIASGVNLDFERDALLKDIERLEPISQCARPRSVRTGFLAGERTTDS